MCYANGKLLPFSPVSTYIWVKLDRFRHLETLCKKLATRLTLLRQLEGSGLSAGAKTLRTPALSLVYATSEYCAPVWCRSAHTRLIDNVLNDALHIVTGCLRPTPTDHLSILSGIQPAELRHLGATLFLAKRGTLDPNGILHGQLTGLSDVPRERLKSGCPYMSATQKLFNDLSNLCAAEWTKYRWSAEYSKGTSVLHVFIPSASSRHLGMGFPRTAWVELNRLRTGVGRFYSFMYKWGLALSPICECGASDQTADHVISLCPIYRAPRGMAGLMVLDDDTRSASI